MLANNFIASASVLSVNKTSTSSLIAPSFKRLAKTLALCDISPTTIRLGYKLSYKALPSLKNSGLKIIRSVLNFFDTSFVYPTGIVLLITIMAFSLQERTFEITSSTAEVSNLLVTSS